MAGAAGRMLVVLALLALTAGAPAGAEEPPAAGGAVAYLESLRGLPDYLPPSAIDPRFTIALYVNAASSGPQRQRMWVLQRDRLGGPWRLALWDAEHWGKKKLAPGAEPAYSWPVSTGRKYPGDPKSGPTPLGVFGLDERKGRIVPGYAGPGMIHALWIDLHYDGGRRSGVAFHGTTPGAYRRLGSVDSHGCIRMHQRNAQALLRRVTGRDRALDEAFRLGEVPRFWLREAGDARLGYSRNGRGYPMALESMRRRLASEGLAAGTGPTPLDAAPAVLTKSGYRVITIIFAD